MDGVGLHRRCFVISGDRRWAHIVLAYYGVYCLIYLLYLHHYRAGSIAHVHFGVWFCIGYLSQ